MFTKNRLLNRFFRGTLKISRTLFPADIHVAGTLVLLRELEAPIGVSKEAKKCPWK